MRRKPSCVGHLCSFCLLRRDRGRCGPSKYYMKRYWEPYGRVPRPNVTLPDPSALYCSGAVTLSIEYCDSEIVIHKVYEVVFSYREILRSAIIHRVAHTRVHVIRFTVYPSECDKRVTRRVRVECMLRKRISHTRHFALRHSTCRTRGVSQGEGY